MSVNLKSLIGKLNQTTRAALEGAAGLALSRTHYDIEIEHFLRKLLDATDSDAAHILRHFGVDSARLTQELDRSLDRLKTGNARTPAISPSLLKMFTEAWTIGSIEFGDGQIRTGLSLLALLSNEELARMVRDISKELQKVNADGLKKEFSAIADASNESVAPLAAAGPSSAAGGGPAKAGSGKQPALDAVHQNLTQKRPQRQDRSGDRPR
jgi:type VI secretion system protein VasG